jgi:phage baseplate assembly protein W
VNNIVLTDLSVSRQDNAALSQGYLYKDIKLDLETSYTYNNKLNKKVPIQDVQALFDVEAVKNSIATCFLTSPGQKILSPEYGIDLRRYLFDSVSQDTAFFIREDILNLLPIFEPRIVVSGVRVEPDPDNNQYNITLKIDIPSLNITGVTLKNYLNTNGYYG